jgi:hypothetical protein
MNNRGQLTFAFVIVLFLLVIVVFAIVDPFKGTLDSVRGGSSLNCPGTPDFNQTSYEAQTSLGKLTYRPTCFVTGISMVWLVGAVLIYGVIWVYNQWRKMRT